MHTGARLEETPAGNPVREAYYRWFNESFKGRSSWDQVAVLYGVRGLSTCFREHTRGSGELRNGFEWPMKARSRSYLTVKIPKEDMEKMIEELMIKPPADPKSIQPGHSAAPPAHER